MKEDNNIDSQTQSPNSEINDDVRPLIDNNKKRKLPKKFSYSNPNNEMIENLNKKRNEGFFKRNFAPLKGGSLRAVVLYWVRMTTGIGVMALPFYMMELGLVICSVTILLAATLSYFSFKYIFNAQYYTGKKDIVNIAKEFLPPWLVTLYSYTLIFDCMSCIQVYIIVSWNLFCYFLYVFGLAKDNWIIDKEKVLFDEYNPEVWVIRVIFLHIIYFACIPLLLKRDLEKLKIVSILFIIFLAFVILMLFIQLPFFYNEYHDQAKPEKLTTVALWKPFWNLKFFSYLFSIILSFYVQPFVMTLRKELLVPSMARLKKVARLSVGIECVLFITLGLICYYVFGDKYTTNLIILRKHLDSYIGLEWVFRIFLFGFFILNTIGIPTYNIGLRNMISHKIYLKRNKIKDDSIVVSQNNLLEKLKVEEPSQEKIEVIIEEQNNQSSEQLNNSKLMIKDLSENMFDRTQNTALSVVSVLDTITNCQYALISLLPMYICVVIAVFYPKLLGIIINI